jgi:hypothetical protein
MVFDEFRDILRPVSDTPPADRNEARPLPARSPRLNTPNTYPDAVGELLFVQ